MWAGVCIHVSWTKRHKWAFFAIVAVIGFALDILTKRWAVATISAGEQVRVLGDVLSFVLVYNKGGIFGLDPRRLVPNLPVDLFFYAFSVVAIVIVTVYYRAMASRDTFARWGLALVMPGALGNLFDRIVHPELGVVDFIMVDLRVPPADPWPVFNFADIYLTVGVLMILAGVAREEWLRWKSAKQTGGEQPADSPMEETSKAGKSDGATPEEHRLTDAAPEQSEKT